MGIYNGWMDNNNNNYNNNKNHLSRGNKTRKGPEITMETGSYFQVISNDLPFTEDVYKNYVFKIYTKHLCAIGFPTAETVINKLE